MGKAYMVVRNDGGRFVVDSYDSRVEFAAAMAASGRVAVRKSSAPLREELRGEPVFAAFHGPMWGGHSSDGRPIVRYEEWSVSEVLSR